VQDLVSWSVLSPVIITLTAFAFAGLERLFPYDRHQRTLREGFWLDMLGYGFFQSAVMGQVIGWLIQVIDTSTHLSRLHLVSSWPVWVQLAFFWVTHDFYIYWFHRLQHHNRFLWRIHEAHHSGKDVDWLSGTRSHSLEILINQTIEFAPIVLLGAAPEVALMKATIDAVWGMFIHSNIAVRMGWLQRVFNGPEMHRWHHAADIRRGVKNFATKIAVWDWLFGTAYLPADKPGEYGLGDAVFPKGYVEQHVFAFRGFEDEAAAAAPTASTEQC